MEVIPDRNVTESLPEEEGDDGEERDEGEEVAAGLLLHQCVVRPAVPDHHDGHGRQPDIHHQVLVVTRLCSNLLLQCIVNKYIHISFHSKI